MVFFTHLIPLIKTRQLKVAFIDNTSLQTDSQLMNTLVQVLDEYFLKNTTSNLKKTIMELFAFSNE